MGLNDKGTEVVKKNTNYLISQFSHYIYDSLRVFTPLKVRIWLRRQSLVKSLLRLLFSSNVYCRSYYDDVERLEGDSVRVIAEWICKYIKPKSAIDVGCGSGQLMEELSKKGVYVFGVDISSEAIRRVKARDLDGCAFDLTDPLATLPGQPYDIAISCEVAEHLKEKYAQVFMEKLTSAAPIVFLTAAAPGIEKGAALHVNENPNSYWISLMSKIGFELHVSATNDARNVFKREGVISYLSVPMIFRKLPSE